MTQIEEIAQQAYKDGISEEEFFKNVAIGTHTRWTMLTQSATYDEVKTRKGFQNVVKHIKDGTLKIRLKDIFSELYEARRLISFKKIPENEQNKMMEALQEDKWMQLKDQDQGFVSPDFVAQQGRGFLHRYPRNRQQQGWSTSQDVLGRFSVNAAMNPDLIKVLDRFSWQHKCTYKTAYPARWADRVDPVTVYMYEPMTDELKKEFVSLMKPYVRNEKPEAHVLLDGETLSPGINCDKELTQEEGMDFINTMPIKFQQDAIEFSNIKKAPMSLGARKTLEEFLDMYKKYAPKVQSNSLNPRANTTKQKIPTAPMPRISTSQKQQTPVDKLILQHFKDGKGHSGIRYLDQQGNVVITETYAPNCKTRVYSNGLTMRMWDNPKSTTYTDGSKTGKEATEIMITEAGRGCTKDVSTTGELKRKIEEVRKAGLLVTDLPNTPQKSSTLRGRLMRHSVDNASKVVGHVGGKVSGA